MISHNSTPLPMEEVLKKYKARIQEAGDQPHVTVKKQLALLQALTEFGFGRFLLQNQGLNGYWTHYMLTHPWCGRKTGLNADNEKLTHLEAFLLDRSPLLLATQERFLLFLQENQPCVQSGNVLAAIPCGLMGELLYLDFKAVSYVKLVGADSDDKALAQARTLADDKGLLNQTTLLKKDAWALNIDESFDLISSNGLNIYDPDPESVVALYQGFYQALKPGGKLVTSFLTSPPGMELECEWVMKNICEEDALLSKIIFVDVLDAKFQCYCSSEMMKAHLEQAGFRSIHFCYDRARMFPTVVAYR
jgi:SAM-dependent methyltransferase